MVKYRHASAMGDLFAAPSTAVSHPSERVTDKGEAQVQNQSQSNPPVLTSVQFAALEAKEAKNLGEDERYLKDVEVAKRFGIARQTVWKHVELGVLPAPIKRPEQQSLAPVQPARA